MISKSPYPKDGYHLRFNETRIRTVPSRADIGRTKDTTAPDESSSPQFYEAVYEREREIGHRGLEYSFRWVDRRVILLLRGHALPDKGNISLKHYLAEENQCCLTALQ